MLLEWVDKILKSMPSVTVKSLLAARGTLRDRLRTLERHTEVENISFLMREAIPMRDALIIMRAHCAF